MLMVNWEIYDSNIDHKNFEKLIKFKRKHSHLRTLISVGGHVSNFEFL